MEKEKISIIVPVYNVENYLEKCVNSIINQTYKNLEIILVDDGSLDNSGEICDKLAKKDSRIIVYHKENGGLSDARNYGVIRATGQYIGFVDSDDYIDKNMYAYLYEMIERENADVAECSFFLVYDNTVKKYYKNNNYYLVLDKEEYLREYLSMEKLYGVIWNKLIRRDLVEKLSFNVGKFYEDSFYSYDLIQIANKYVISGKELYYYYVRENSITNSEFNEKHLHNIEIIEKFREFTNESYPSLKEEAFNREVYAHISIINKIIQDKSYKKNKYYKKLKNYIFKNIIKILKSKKIENKRKLAALLLSINGKLYRKVLFKYTKEISK